MLSYFKKANSVVAQEVTAPATSELDAAPAVQTQKKPLAETTSPRVEQQHNQNQKSNTEKAQQNKVSSNPGAGDYVSESDEDIEPVEVLLQFIPYYGRGDASNDSIVRSTLKGLSVQDIDSKDEYGNTLLLLACQYRCEDLVRIMLNKGADPNAANSSGACCLHFACYRDSASYTIAKILLANGANPDVAESSFGCTPLHYCAGTGDIEFCKLLLSAGAQVNTCDYYNYTCVDYAREAGMQDVASFLQQRLEKATQMQSRAFGSMQSMKQFLPQNQNAAASSMYSDMSNWESHVDPGSKGKYYIHLKTGECLWEAELKERILQVKQQQQQQATPAASQKQSPPSQSSAAVDIPTKPVNSAANEAFLITQATTARLIAFFSTHDPSRLPEIETLVVNYKGKEQELMAELCAKYKVQEDGEFLAFQKKINEIKGISDQAPANSKNPALVQEIQNELRVHFEMQLEVERSAIKRTFENQMDEERNVHRKAVSEKEGEISKLRSELESVQRLNTNAEVMRLFHFCVEDRENKLILPSNNNQSFNE
jgi:hypothetical protein